jgi:hypothetical protein
MEIRKLDRRICLEIWGDGRNLPSVDTKELTADEMIVRGRCRDAFANYSDLTAYKLDAAFSINLYYDILSIEGGFSLRAAADDSVWRRLSVQVLPDYVAVRWGPGADGLLPRDHYWNRSQRVWLKCLWWYCHLSRQCTREETRNVLQFGSTDAIQAVVERPGEGGFRVELCREIMKRLTHAGFSVELLKRVMKLNTTRVGLVEPAFFCGGIAGYVDSLIEGLRDA